MICLGSWEEAESWLQLYPGSKIGLTGAVTNSQMKAVHKVAKLVPLLLVPHLLLQPSDLQLVHEADDHDGEDHDDGEDADNCDD